MNEYIGISELEQSFVDQEKPLIICVDIAGIDTAVGNITATATVLNYGKFPKNVLRDLSNVDAEELTTLCEMYKAFVPVVETYSVPSTELSSAQDVARLKHLASYRAVERATWSLFKLKLSPHVVICHNHSLKEPLLITKSMYELIEPQSFRELVPNVTLINIDKNKEIAGIFVANAFARYALLQDLKALSAGYPEFNLCQNFGMLTDEHKESLKKFGITPYHRTWMNLGENLHSYIQKNPLPKDLFAEVKSEKPTLGTDKLINIFSSLNVKS